MPVLEEVLAANAEYARTFGVKGDLALPPARRFAILTCMDARLDPAKYAGLSEGDAHVIRNAGGRASDDAIRSLVISYKLLGTAEWFVIHHTDCGMEFFTERRHARPARAEPRDRRARRRTASTTSAPGPARAKAHDIDWLTIADREQSVVEDVTPHPQPPARAGGHPDLRLRLRRHDRQPRGGRGRHGGRPPNLTPSRRRPSRGRHTSLAIVKARCRRPLLPRRSEASTSSGSGRPRAGVVLHVCAR